MQAIYLVKNLSRDRIPFLYLVLVGGVGLSHFDVAANVVSDGQHPPFVGGRSENAQSNLRGVVLLSLLVIALGDIEYLPDVNTTCQQVNH